MKKLISVLLALTLLLGCGSMALAAGDRVFHTEEKYLTDTLTLAGSGFDAVRTLSVSVVEGLYRDADAGLAYENTYSMMTSGGVFSKHVFTGVRLYELLVREGLDVSLPDTTPVKLISKDGYTIAMTLGQIRGGFSRYSARGGELEEAGLPVLIAFASDGESLVGPTGKESVYIRFDESTGYVEGSDNIGGPLRLVVGQTASTEFNAPSCAKWLSAVVVGDANGYAYTRETDAQVVDSHPDQTGDWTHQGKQADYRLKISGSEARETVYLSLAEIEAMKDGTVREYFAASAGRNAYEGVTLRYLVESFLREGLERPTKVTVKAADGYTKQCDIDTLLSGIDSLYQPGCHRDMLLAWAIDGAPLVPNESSEGYNGKNGYGPLRFVVENTISMWVKNVSEIIIGEETGDISGGYTDVDEGSFGYAGIMDMTARGLMNGIGGGKFDPDGSVTRAQAATIFWRMSGSPVVNYSMSFEDVGEGAWYAEAVRFCASERVINGYSETAFGPDDAVTREQLACLIFRYAAANGLDAVTLEENLHFADSGDISEYAVTALNWCVGRGLIDGLNDGLLHPGQAATRAQLAAALSGYLAFMGT